MSTLLLTAPQTAWTGNRRLPAMHARALGNYSSHSSPIKDVLGDILTCVNTGAVERFGNQETDLQGLPNTNPSGRALAL